MLYVQYLYTLFWTNFIAYAKIKKTKSIDLCDKILLGSYSEKKVNLNKNTSIVSGYMYRVRCISAAYIVMYLYCYMCRYTIHIFRIVFFFIFFVHNPTICKYLLPTYFYIPMTYIIHQYCIRFYYYII